MSWKATFACVALAIAGGFGCLREHCTNEADCFYAHSLCITPHLSPGPDATISPAPPAVPSPMTVDNTLRKPHYMSLREAQALALENGTVGNQNPASPGFASDNLSSFLGTTVGSADSIRVLALDPAIVALNIELSLSKFDTMWNTAAAWNHTDTPFGTLPPLASNGVSGYPTVGTAIQDTTTVSTTLLKPLPTGGVAGITFSNELLSSKPSATLGSTYQPNLQFSFEQPLLQGFGVEINQLREAHPGSLLAPFNTATGVEGILITRLRFDQQRAEFKRNLNYMLLNVEAAYWNLYGAYFTLFSQEEGMRNAYELWRFTKSGFDEGKAAAQDLAQAQLQYELFRSQRLQALGQALESERQLRGLLGLKSEDGRRIIPTDKPTLTPVQPDWNTALHETFNRRPELVLARQDFHARQLLLMRQKDHLLPDLRVLATTNVHSLGGDLDGGPTTNNAFHQLVSDPFVDWSLGLQMTVPVGFRAGNASVQLAKLALERSYLSLRTEEDKAERFLESAYRRVIQYEQQIQVQYAGFQAATTELDKYYELYRHGRFPAYGADLILAQRDWSTSLNNWYQSIVQYNNALATFEFAKGTIMQHNGVYIADGTLPNCAQIRAVDHERERTRALLVQEPRRFKESRSCVPSTDDQPPPLPAIPENEALSLPAIQLERPPVPEMKDEG